MRELFTDEVFVESPTGERFGPIKASVQGSKVFIADETAPVEEGGRILRPLPNGKSESHAILQVDYHNGGPFARRLSHYELRTRKEASLVPTPSKTSITVTNSHGVVIGDGNVQNIVSSFEAVLRSIDRSDGSAKDKAEAKGKLKAFLTHPLTSAALGAVLPQVLAML